MATAAQRGIASSVNLSHGDRVELNVGSENLLAEPEEIFGSWRRSLVAVTTCSTASMTGVGIPQAAPLTAGRSDLDTVAPWHRKGANLQREHLVHNPTPASQITCKHLP